MQSGGSVDSLGALKEQSRSQPGQAAEGWAPQSLPTSARCFLRNGSMRSMGIGKMVVEFFSVAISARVCR